MQGRFSLLKNLLWGGGLHPLVTLFFLALLLFGCGGGKPKEGREEESRVSRCGAFVGVDFLSALSPKFPISLAYRAFDGVDCPALGALWGTFGKRWSNLGAFTARVQDREHVVRVHPWSCVCFRRSPPNCSDGEIRIGWTTEDFNRALERRDSRLRDDIQRRVGTIHFTLEAYRKEGSQFVLSLGLEDDYTAEAASVALEWVREAWPHRIIRNPHRGELVGLDIETHGAVDRGGTIHSLDGADLFFPHRAPTLFQQAPTRAAAQLIASRDERFVTFLWRADHQGLVGGTVDSGPPMERALIFQARDSVVMNRLLRGLSLKE